MFPVHHHLGAGPPPCVPCCQYSLDLEPCEGVRSGLAADRLWASWGCVGSLGSRESRAQGGCFCPAQVWGDRNQGARPEDSSQAPKPAAPAEGTKGFPQSQWGPCY